MKVFLCGDVMTGRGIDQVLPHPSDPKLHEDFVKSARGYVELAENANGPIPRKVDWRYIWGDALYELERLKPDVRVINLETAVTTSTQWLDKGINYRMHPANLGCLTVARIDCCSLANNHLLDWGRHGLLETVDVLRRAGLKTAGAGRDLDEARAAAIVGVPGKGRVLVFSFATESSGVPPEWAATSERAGVSFLEDFSERTVREIKARIARVKRAGDIAIASIHWGGNWGFEVPEAHRRFARALIDEARVDVIHGHSSHHPLGYEVYRDRLVLYGCGDFINDYEGIGGYESFRGELSVMYFASIRPSDGHLAALELVTLRKRRFRLERASAADAAWISELLNRERKRLAKAG